MITKINAFRRVHVVILSVLLVGIASYFAYVAGMNSAIGRSAYVNATFVRVEEQQCIRSNDMECMKAFWRIRAEAAAESARRSNNGFGNSSVEKELAEYIGWVETLPPPGRRKK
ncbi:hypothetical protein LQ564_02840 [Massilia sp. G4R7]|uniref:Uncharacterized protein n=1 Tax=Massilia phyllostachyos TaxID=2898585 RepID=A0ABS8Q0H3_9BURK|nr:hypothetical protein [Massilia phyllostachyos]MCD2515245.1 hypothetical protein [Massilia phyllostachyos]